MFENVILLTHPANSIRDSVEILFSFRKSRAFLIPVNPSSNGILGYCPITSIAHSLTLSGKGGRLANLDEESFNVRLNVLGKWLKMILIKEKYFLCKIQSLK